MIEVETNGVEIKNFKKVVIIYNPNSGKQIFVSMLSRVPEQGGAYGAARV